MKRLYIWLFFPFLWGSCDDIRRNYNDPDLTPELQQPTLTIAQMLAMYDGENPLTFTEDYLIGGVVTASDESGNFYRTFVIDDLTGAVEIMAGGYDLHTLYPIGRVVYVKVKGLTLSYSSTGIYQLGLKAVASSGYTVDYIAHSALLDDYITRAGMNYEFRYAECTIPQLTDALLGRLVTVYGLTLRNGGETTWATVQGRYPKDIRADDPEGNFLYIYTTAYSDFADETIPAGVCSISGILMKNGNNRYRIKMRDLRDVVEH